MAQNPRRVMYNLDVKFWIVWGSDDCEWDVYIGSLASDGDAMLPEAWSEGQWYPTVCGYVQCMVMFIQQMRIACAN